jgi:hypothetical protein
VRCLLFAENTYARTAGGPLPLLLLLRAAATVPHGALRGRLLRMAQRSQGVTRSAGTPLCMHAGCVLASPRAARMTLLLLLLLLLLQARAETRGRVCARASGRGFG